MYQTVLFRTNNKIIERVNLDKILTIVLHHAFERVGDSTQARACNQKLASFGHDLFCMQILEGEQLREIRVELSPNVAYVRYSSAHTQVGVGERIYILGQRK